MAATLREIRGALQSRVEAVTGLRAYDKGTGQEQMPCAIFWPTGTSIMGSAGADAVYEYTFNCEVWVGIGIGLGKAQDLMDDYLDPRGAKSVEAAIEGTGDTAQTLGGLVQSVSCNGFTGYVYGRLNLPPNNPPNAIVATTAISVYSA
jgi:hypothetical protein